MGLPLFGYIASVLATLFYLGIITAILTGRTSPNRTTWLIWGVNDFLLLVASYLVGARNTLGVPVVYAVCGLVCIVLSFKHDSQKPAKLDLLCLGISVMAWILLFLTSVPVISLALAVLVNTLGALPTWRKIWLNPRSEAWQPWALVFLSGVSMLIAVEDWRVDLLLFPVDSTLVSGTTLYLALRGRRSI